MEKRQQASNKLAKGKEVECNAYMHVALLTLERCPAIPDVADLEEK